MQVGDLVADVPCNVDLAAFELSDSGDRVISNRLDAFGSLY